jgi:hypothetical protein
MPPNNTPTAIRRLVSLAEFSLRSLPQPYGRDFLKRVVCDHPVRLLSGAWRYLKGLGAPEGRARMLDGDEASFLATAPAAGARLLVATGFCQKPLGGISGTEGCPASRFSHECLLQNSWGGVDVNDVPSAACLGCTVRVLGRAALRAGASFAVLTSAEDIAADVLLPALERRRFTHCLVAICPYSMEPMSLALLTCGFLGLLYPYTSGACSDFGSWLRADGGEKPEQTLLSAGALRRLIALLRLLTRERQRLGLLPSTHFLADGNVYVPS